MAAAAAVATEPRPMTSKNALGAAASTPRPRVVERYGRSARWFHAAVYVTVLVLLATGWWLLAGREGQPSPLARMSGTSDTSLHKMVGWAFVAVAAAGVVLGWRGSRTFVVESLRVDGSDGRWLLRWPAAVLTGRFGRHEGHFDPGQRFLNVVMVLSLAAVTGSGVGLVMVHGGPTFVWLALVHKWSTYVLTPLILGHIVIASGVLRGYRGVWRSMHLGGRLDAAVARRLWPRWLEDATGRRGERSPAGEDRGRAD